MAFTRDAEFTRSYFGTYEVPEQFRDNLIVMRAVFSKIGTSFRYASRRLKDDGELLRIASFSEDSWLMAAVEEASERLKNDKTFVTELLVDFCTDYDHEQREHYWYC